MNFPTFLMKARQKQLDFMPPVHMVAFDPGETTGYAYFKNGTLVETKELPTHRVTDSIDLLMRHLPNIQSSRPDTSLHVVYENYKIYSWKTESHSWDNLHTPRLIGAIQCLCTLQKLSMTAQMAQQAKGFCTDQKLKEWGYYDKGMRHARDAVRHGCYYLLFNHQKPIK